MNNLDWHNIRPLNGSQANGFEELCVQLARSECPDSARFNRKGTPDAGVECYAVLANNSEWGWQSKYFSSLEKSQWKQLDDTVKTALIKHPLLTKYYICIPLDRPDARNKNQQSTMKQWENHVSKWTDWAVERKMNVEFIWWGSSELMDLLTKKQNAGRLYFWFNAHVFTDEWYRKRLEAAIVTAGPRYTPEVNINLPIQEHFEAFGRTERFYEAIKTHIRPIREGLISLRNALRSITDEEITATFSTFCEYTEELIAGVSGFCASPIEKLPFTELMNTLTKAQTYIENINNLIYIKDEEQDYKPTDLERKKQKFHPPKNSIYRESLYSVRVVLGELKKIDKILHHGDEYANNPLLLIKGEGGVGKTHLLCDAAKLRIDAGKPTILLLGQWFIGITDPWTQILEKLDLRDIKVEQLIGSLGASAQSTNSRAIFIIDALNEGEGRILWPSHLAMILNELQCSPWISVVLSIRTSYEDVIIPQNIRSRAINLTHDGFLDHEYNAVKTFFLHYGLELPSTPILSNEFKNPLYLKTLCLGLSGSGQSRLPRGFHGITMTFDLYLSMVNIRLAFKLEYNSRWTYVKDALLSFVNCLADENKRWLGITKAMNIVNSCLPDQGHGISLYRGLVNEGILIEDNILVDNRHECVVFIGYERLADHLIVDFLLNKYLEQSLPERAFDIDGPLAFLYDNRIYTSPGVIEALCIQVPERTGKELASLAPQLADKWYWGNAFRQSIVWRATSAFSEETRSILDELINSDSELYETMDIILTVASIPDHPLNALSLDKRLSRYSMAERDSWWSIYLHHAWGGQGPIDRLVDWASSIDSSKSLEDDTVSLCAITLTWMLTTSNRFLRDRATKAIVCLLSGRINILMELIDRFHTINDLYVLERLYAIAYGVAMRSDNKIDVGALAEKVYGYVFADGSPPAHILLRDYARCTIERALHIKKDTSINHNSIKPPYFSLWPFIPSDNDIVKLIPELTNANKLSSIEMAPYEIKSSVYFGDFARYVVGVNLEHSHWLSNPITHERWLSVDERLSNIVNDFTSDEKMAMKCFQEAQDFINVKNILEDFERSNDVVGLDLLTDNEHIKSKINNLCNNKWALLESVLTRTHYVQIHELLSGTINNCNSKIPYLDIIPIQRYILWRVFDLGWTTEYFGQFDRFYTASSDNTARKAERIGKKYQWIAFHEILAYISDHYQYFDGFASPIEHTYEGTWQLCLRDIDPSCTLQLVPGGTEWGGHDSAWWCPISYDNWRDENSPMKWVAQKDDLPSIEGLLKIQSPDNGTPWINLHGYYEWNHPIPSDIGDRDAERREFWYICDAYIIHMEDLEAFMSWAKQKTYAGRWMPEPPSDYAMFLGEHGWSPASRYFDKQRWHKHYHDCPVEFCMTTYQYLQERSGFDCSIDETYSLSIPDCIFFKNTDMKWTATAADYSNTRGEIVCMDPTAHAPGPSAFLIREDYLREFLERNNYAMVWAVIGEKRTLGPDGPNKFTGELSIYGAYYLDKEGLRGFLNTKLETSDRPTPVKSPR